MEARCCNNDTVKTEKLSGQWRRGAELSMQYDMTIRYCHGAAPREVRAWRAHPRREARACGAPHGAPPCDREDGDEGDDAFVAAVGGGDQGRGREARRRRLEASSRRRDVTATRRHGDETSRRRDVTRRRHVTATRRHGDDTSRRRHVTATRRHGDDTSHGYDTSRRRHVTATRRHGDETSRRRHVTATRRHGAVRRHGASSP